MAAAVVKASPVDRSQIWAVWSVNSVRRNRLVSTNPIRNTSRSVTIGGQASFPDSRFTTRTLPVSSTFALIRPSVLVAVSLDSASGRNEMRSGARRVKSQSRAPLRR